MNQSLFHFAWLEVTRSSYKDKSLFSNIMLGFIALYFVLNFVVLGISVPAILAKTYPVSDPVLKFNNLLFYYFLSDLFVRQLLQGLPTFSFKSFILQNIHRNRIVRYMLSRSVLHFLNILPYFMLFPVTIMMIGKHYPEINTAAWLFSLALMVFTNHFLSVYLKWKINESRYGLYILIAVIAGLFAINHYGTLDLSSIFGSYFNVVLRYPLSAVAMIIPPCFCYYLNFKMLRNHLYLDEVEKKQNRNIVVNDLSWTSRLGEYGKFISLEMRMIWRNKRPRSQFLMSVVFLLYGLLIYRNPKGVPDSIFLLGGMLMISMFSFTMGQFFPAWHSRYFPLLMTQNIKMKQFLKSFYYMNLFASVIYYLLSLPYLLIDSRVIYFHSVILLYHLGININFLIYWGQFSKRAVDLSRSAMFNYQGTGATQMLIGIPTIVFPLLLFSLVKMIAGTNIALTVLGGAGIIGILFQNKLFDYFVEIYLKKKYQLISNYKNS